MIGMKEYPDNYFDLAVVDPPYGIGVAKMAYTQEDNRPVKQKNGSVLRVKKLKYKHGEWDNKPAGINYVNELKRVSKNQIIWGINYMDFHLKGGRIIWNKCVPEGVSFSDCEIAYTNIHQRVRIYTFMWAGMFQGSPDNGTKMQGNKSLNEVRIHPTQKPIKLYEWIFKNYAKEGQKILDTHLGSGSSRIAAYNYGMDFTGYEIDKDYFEVAEKRFQDHVAANKFKNEAWNVVNETPKQSEIFD